MVCIYHTVGEGVVQHGLYITLWGRVWYSMVCIYHPEREGIYHTMREGVVWSVYHTVSHCEGVV